MMDIEKLTKAQIILLTLLVSFVTSIATGIVTVTLMDQAPGGVTQVINRVVERTVERVVPEGGQEATAAGSGKNVQEVTTVVVKENDLITEAIENNSKTLVRIGKRSSNKNDDPGSFVGLGFFVKTDGTLVTDASLIEGGGKYGGTLADGTIVTLRVIKDSNDTGIALLRVEASPENAGVLYPAMTFADPATIKLGQSVIALNGEGRTNVSLGIVTDVERSTETEPIIVTRITTDISDAATTYGSPLFNIFGEAVGVHTARAHVVGSASYTPMAGVRELLASTETE